MTPQLLATGAMSRPRRLWLTLERALIITGIAVAIVAFVIGFVSVD